MKLIIRINNYVSYVIDFKEIICNIKPEIVIRVDQREWTYCIVKTVCINVINS